MLEPLSFQEFNELLSYDKDDGLLRWRVGRGSRKAGVVVGGLDRTGYVRLQTKGKSYFAHRVIWLLHTGQWPVGQVDHINRNRSDNRIANLRDVSVAENARNKKSNKNIGPNLKPRVPVLTSSYEDVNRVLSLDVVTGVLTRKFDYNRWKMGEVAGTLGMAGYLHIQVRGKSYLAHRVAWLLHYKEWPVGIVDHIDGNRLNNSPYNLRIVSASVNAKNIRKDKDIGVSFDKDKDKWRAGISRDKKRKHLGYFTNKEDAIEAYQKASIELYPELH